MRKASPLKTVSGMDSFALIFDMDISEYSGYRDFVWAVELNRFGLELVGLWPKTDVAARSNFSSDLRVATTFVIITFACVIPNLCSLVRIWGEMTLMIDNIQITLPLIIIPIKLLIIRWKKTVFSSLVKTMAEDWSTLKIDSERNVMLRRAQTARKIIIFGYVLMVFGIVIVVLLPSFGIPFRNVINITDRRRLLPFESYSFYDSDKSPQFELTFIVQAISAFFSVIIYTSADAFLGLAILHICGQLENFRGRLTNLILYKDFNSALRNNVAYHLRLIRFARNIDDMFSLMLLVLVVYFGIVFCLFGYLFLTMFTNDGISNVSFLSVCFVLLGVSVLFAHTFLYCTAGDILEEQCDAVHRAICDVEWYRLESRNGKTIILLMIQANQPFRITAGKMFPLTMTMFCKLLKSSLGCISVLLAIRG